MSTATLIIAAAIVVVIVARRVSPVIGGVFGMVVPLGVGVWGWLTYEAGGQIAFVNFALSREIFFALVLVWFALETFGFRSVLRGRRAPRD